jgi:hypothetical protein
VLFRWGGGVGGCCPGPDTGGGHWQWAGLPHQASWLMACLPIPLGLATLCQGNKARFSDFFFEAKPCVSFFKNWN